MPCHHPNVVSTHGRGLWYNLVKGGLGLDAKALVRSEWQRIITILTPFVSSSEYLRHMAGILATKELAG